MIEKIFISFLGTSDYMPCNYYFADDKVENVEFVQEAIIRIFFSEKERENSKFLFFLTKEAKEKNWKKLKKRLSHIIKDENIKEIYIPTGKSEDEIWEIFKIVYSNIHENSYIIFDITHAFRSIPMIAIVLLNYAKVMKNIKIGGIYYGAFESLGSFKYVKENIPLPERNAPIFDLTKIHELQEWTIAADNFISLGNPVKLLNMMETIDKRSSNVFSKKFLNIVKNNLKKALKDGWESIYAVRGKKIFQGKAFEELNKEFIKVKQKGRGITPFEKLLEKVIHRFKNYRQNSLQNVLIAIEYCIEHNLVQQGITLARELFISCIFEKLNLEADIEKISERKNRNKFIKDVREIISSIAVLYAEENIDELKDKGLPLNIIEKIKSDIEVKKYCREFYKLTEYRNSINHAGITDDFTMKQFRNYLIEFKEKVLEEMIK